MKLSEVPSEYKVFNLNMSNGKTHAVTGEQLNKILDPKYENNIFMLGENEGINKNHIVDWSINKEWTRENVIKNKAKLLVSEIGS
jgi:hypothetical protein